ncbi:MAG TPA: hypothetical protein VLE74_02005 [Candidatus Saccharimonadales bacterium]|nr:hypothetical protein [Candidatus Saccharimonadales bacterium]
MYSGLTIFSKHSGILLGAHQKIDRVSRKQLLQLPGGGSGFPTIREILHFEGVNGPDGIKRKSPGKDEPWHYVNPFDEKDTRLSEMLKEHYVELIKALEAQDSVRAAFEAAWLAHALVDGLTPAHHYPYEEELSKLRGGEGLETRTNYRKKLIIPGETRRAKVRNNWKMWGAGGLYTTHASFEMGVATLILPLTFKDALPSRADIAAAHKLGVAELFRRTAREVAVLDIYHNYLRKGWTPKMAWQIRHQLGPALVSTVTLVWHSALLDAGLVKE